MSRSNPGSRELERENTMTTIDCTTYDRAKERNYLKELYEGLKTDPEYTYNMLSDSVQEAADGCSVEPDGTCPHGYRSPCLLLGVI